MTSVLHRAAPPLPVGFTVELDPHTVEVRPGVWFNGRRGRVLRLSDEAVAVWDNLRNGALIAGRVDGVVARRFVAAGLAHPVPVTPPATQEITVVVPVRDRVAELDRCLTVLGERHPVIVVDDASVDAGAVRRVADRHGARTVRLTRNVGPAGARNAGLACVDSVLVAFVDSDTECPADALDAVAAQLDDRTVGAAAPRIVAAPAGRSVLARYVRARGSLDLGDAAGEVEPYAPVSYVPTAVLVAATTTLREIARDGDVFDSALRYGEDVDLVWRLNAAGRRVRYDPSVTVRHHDPTSWRALLGRRFRYGTSAAPLALRHPGDLAPVVVQPWYAGAVVALLARRPVTATALVVGALLTTRRALRAAGLPGRTLPLGHTGAAVARSWTALARCAVQFAAPALLAAVAVRRSRVRALAVLLSPAVHDWYTRHPSLDPLRFVAADIADDCAYGAGVLAGCLRHRTAAPLRPVRAGSLHR